jgi:hypothetical protein
LLQSSMKVSAEDGRTQRDDSATGTKPAAGARP